MHLGRTRHSHGGHTGSNPVRNANFVQILSRSLTGSQRSGRSGCSILAKTQHLDSFFSPSHLNYRQLPQQKFADTVTAATSSQSHLRTVPK